MEMSDDKLNFDEHHIPEEKVKHEAKDDLDGVSARKSKKADVEKEKLDVKQNKAEEEDSVSKESGGGIGELVAVSVKAVAVALSLIILLTCILAVGLPLQTMRIFNSLGMSARAVDFGERYVGRELRSFDADSTDQRGNYVVLSQTAGLANADFLEALYVTINLSSKLMEEYYGAGDDRTGEYYAHRVEKYTRMYMSLYDISRITREQSESDMQAVPMIAMRPSVYDYAHSIRSLNYRARSYLGETEYMLYGFNRPGESINTLDERSNSVAGTVLPDSTDDATVTSVIDGFVDYVSQLGEYLDVAFLRAGVENDLSVKTPSGSSIVSETYVGKTYLNVLDGDEFSLFISRTDGFTAVYNSLKRFSEYAQLAVDFNPSDRYGNKEDEQLHQLYWLQNLYSAQQRLWYMSMLMYYNSGKFGQSAQAVRDEYGMGTCRDFMFVTYQGKLDTILGVYQKKFAEYLSQYQS